MAQKDLIEDPIRKYYNYITPFGLSEEEAKVFLSLLKRGTRGEIVGRIKEELSIGRTTIYAILERLTVKGWVIAEEISENPKRVKFVAKSPFQVLNEIISFKENELSLLKKNSLHVGDRLETIYQGAKKLSLENVHPGGYRYLKPLIESGWKIKSEVVEHNETLRRLTLDYELKGKKGFPKDSGLIIFMYDRIIEEDNLTINSAFELFKSKTDYEIHQDKIPGFEELKFEDKSFKGFPGAEIFIKLKFKKDWWLVGKQAVIPIKEKIFLIFGNKVNFKTLFQMILKSEDFRHLV